MSEKADVLLEHLAVLECKLDGVMQVLVQLAAASGVELQPVVTENYRCPYCKQLVSFQISFPAGAVERSCGCGTGLIPPPTQEAVAKMMEQTAPRGRETQDGGTGRGEDDAAAAAEAADDLATALSDQRQRR